MYADGFHYTRSKNDVGYKVPAHALETAETIAMVSGKAGWRYSVNVPDTGKNQSVYWFSYEDLEHLMQVDRTEVKRLARVYTWRSRLNNTTKTRQFYMFDILATVWLYMTDYFGHKIDMDLLEEARERYTG